MLRLAAFFGEIFLDNERSENEESRHSFLRVIGMGCAARG